MRSHFNMATALVAIAVVLMTSLHDVCHAEPLFRDVYVGETANLPCDVTAPPSNVISEWSKDGNVAVMFSTIVDNKTYAELAGRSEIVPNDYHLLIQNTVVNDTGDYGCRFVGGEFPTPTKVQLTVYRKPSVTVETQRITGNKKQVMATCTVLNAIANSKLEWKETSGVEVVAKQPEAKRTSMEGVDGGEYYKLTMHYKAKPSFDPSELLCVYTHPDFQQHSELRNRTAKAKATLDFMTTTPATTTTVSPAQPSIYEDTLPEGELTMEQGSDKNFTCQASGNPAPTVSWKFGDADINDGASGMNTIYIKDAQLENTGTYICFASSDLGTVNKTFTIKVTASPKMLQPEEESSEHQLTVDMNSVDLRCDVKSNPVSNIEWIFEMEPERPVEGATETTNGYTKESSVSIPHTEFSSEEVTRIVCVATNKHGEERRSFAVTKEARPGISSAMIVVVIIVLVVFIAALVGAVVLHRRKVVARANAGNVESGCAQTLLCVKAPQLESDDKSEPVDDDVVKEEDEEEADEKQHLTEATVENDAAEQPQDVAEEEKMLESPKKKLNLTGSLGCCRRSRKKLQEDEDDDDVTGNDNKNGDATANGDGATQEDASAKNAALESISEEKKDADVINDADSDRDSGKGDTLKPMTVANGDEGATTDNNTADNNGSADVTATEQK